MKILLFDAGSFTCRDVKEEIEKQGHSVELMYYHFKDRYSDEFFEGRIELQLRRNKYDSVFSINFFPLVAIACKNADVPYISWSYDSPLDDKLTEFFGYSTNHIFLFDREEVQGYQKRGFTNVMHMPLAINVKRLEQIKYDGKYSADVSFVGQIYESQLDTLLFAANDYVKGYVEGLFQAQLRIYGCNFLEKSIPDSVLGSLNESFESIGQTAVRLNKRGLAYAIASQITHVERSFLINELSQLYDVKVYTAEECNLEDSVKVFGPVKYFSEMNQVFLGSKLNLCPTLKSIASGIPLRALDIMGVGGTLFSNYQPELAEIFVDGQDLIMYESIEDAFVKADYYIKNVDELKRIAFSGHEKVKEYFGYENRIAEMLKVI